MSQDFKALSELLAKITNRVPIMRIIAGTMHTAVMKNFEAEGRPGKWQQLAKSTIKDRSKKGYWPGRILQRSGALKRSVLQDSNNNEAIVSVNLRYAAIQNFGGIIHRSSIKTYIRKKKSGIPATKPKKNLMSSIRIPARPFMFLPDEAIKDIESDIIDYLTR